MFKSKYLTTPPTIHSSQPPSLYCDYITILLAFFHNSIYVFKSPYYNSGTLTAKTCKIFSKRHKMADQNSTQLETIDKCFFFHTDIYGESDISLYCTAYQKHTQSNLYVNSGPTRTQFPNSRLPHSIQLSSIFRRTTMFAGSAFVYLQETSKRHHNKTDANTLNPKIHRTIPNTLSKAHQRRPTASRLFPTRHLLCCYLVRRPLQMFLQKTKTCLLPCSSSKLSQHAFHSHVITQRYTSSLYFHHALRLPSMPCFQNTVQRFNKPNKSISFCHLAAAIMNYYRLLRGTRRPQTYHPQNTQLEHIFFKQITKLQQINKQKNNS